MRFTFDELVNITQATILIDKRDDLDKDLLFSVSTDTRTITENDIYLPLKGEVFDGEQFITLAIENGSCCYFTTGDEKYDCKFALKVDDTRIAYLRLANYYKNKINPLTIAITGSSGKTTTKEIVSSIFEANYKTHKSKLNYNNEVGLCKTLLSMPLDTEVLIVEMGMRGLGEIDLLSKYAQPNYAIITNIGTAHIGRLGSRENIARAKCEVVNHLQSNGSVVTYYDELYEKYIDKTRFSHIVIDENEFKIDIMAYNLSKFNYKDGAYVLNIGGEYNVLDALLGIEVALISGLSPSKIQNGLDNYKPIEKRFEEVVVNNLTIINDSYNANPDSMKVAIKSFVELYDGNKILVLADMKELGEDEIKYHEDIGEYLNSFNNIKVYTIGELARYISSKTIHETMHFSENIEVVSQLKRIKEKTKVFLKGSNSMNLFEIVEEIKK